MRSEDPSMPLLSVCMIVKNEAKNLGRALESVRPLGAEIVVVDTGSTDETKAVAEAYGARVFDFAWVDDFSAARNFAMSQATGAWLIVLDADEVLSEAFVANVEGAVAGAPSGGIRVPAHNFDAENRLQQRTTSTRIVKKNAAFVYEGCVHEEIETSILGAGGVITSEDLPIFHYGYTAEESQRKSRGERNLRLLRAAHEADPENPRYFHYLGLELAVAGDYAQAARWLERVVFEHPDHVLAGWSAAELTTIRMSERAFGAAWEAASFGINANLGRVASLFRLGDLALREGDAMTALRCANALDKVQNDVEGDVDRRAQRTIILRAKALAERGNVDEAYTTLLRAVRKFQNDAGVADELVRMAERKYPRDRAGVMAAKDAGLASVVAAAAGTFARSRAWTCATEVGDRYGLSNEYYAYALLRTGRIEQALQVFGTFGESGAVHVLLVGLERQDERVTAEALTKLPTHWAGVAERVMKGRSVAPAYAWLLFDWLRIALDMRSDLLATRLVACLPGTPAERSATHALLLLEASEPMLALRLALATPNEPMAAEVIGIVAHEKKDYAAAAAMLLLRARAGDAPAHVFAKGHDALRRTSPALVGELLTLARASRPTSALVESLTKSQGT